MHKKFWLLGCIFGLTAVVLGAFGAHVLKSQLGPGALNTFETGVRYQFYHTFALLITGFLFKNHPVKWYRIAGWLFVTGILCFSGSLYLLSLRPLLGIEHWTWLGPVTPIGGLLFILGWLLLIIGITTDK